MSDVRLDAAGRWRDVLSAVGVDRKFLINRHGPCPLCGGKDRFRFDDREGKGTYFCSHCGAGDGFTLVMKIRSISFLAAADLVRNLVGTARIVRPPKRDDTQAKARANELWRSAVCWPGTTVERYLAGRGLSHRAWRDIRFLGGKDPSMIALCRAPDGAPATVHRTFLAVDGNGKADVPAPRKFASGVSLPKGAAVRLCPAEKTLGVAEGIETAMSATVLFGIPCWSALSAGNLSGWWPPPDVERVVIFGDHDRNFVGQAAAYGLAQRLAQKFAVEVKIPDKPGDWNDELLSGEVI